MRSPALIKRDHTSIKRPGRSSTKTGGSSPSAPAVPLPPCRLRYLTDGYVLGFAEDVKEAARLLKGLRKKPARPKPAGPLEGLAVFPGMQGALEGAWGSPRVK